MTDAMEIETAPHERQLVKYGAQNQIFPAELSLFEAPPLSAAYVSEQFVDYRASTPNLNSRGSIYFVIPPMVSQFVSLARSRLHVRFKIVQADGKRIDPDLEELVAPINYIAGTLFETVHLYMNQVHVSPGGSQHVPYRAYTLRHFWTGREMRKIASWRTVFSRGIHQVSLTSVTGRIPDLLNDSPTQSILTPLTS